MKKVSPAEYARHRGISRQYVSKLIKLGAIRLDPGGKIDMEAADLALDKSGGVKETFYDARARKESALASIRELELRAKKGELLPAKEVRQVWEKHIGDCRARLLSIPHSLAPVLSPVKSIPEIKEILEEKIHEALQELSVGDNNQNGGEKNEQNRASHQHSKNAPRSKTGKRRNPDTR